MYQQDKQAKQTIVLAPPAWVIRQQAGLGVPGARGLIQAAAGAMTGAAASAVFIGALGDPGARFVGALITGALGTYFAAVSPLGTIPREIGLGMVATSFSHMYYALFRQYT